MVGAGLQKAVRGAGVGLGLAVERGNNLSKIVDGIDNAAKSADELAEITKNAENISKAIDDVLKKEEIPKEPELVKPLEEEAPPCPVKISTVNPLIALLTGIRVEASCIDISNAKYEGVDYHGSEGNSVKSAAPINGQASLMESIQIKSTSPRRIAIQGDDEFVIFDMTTDGIYHGHVRQWTELTPEMRSVLIRAKLTKPNGKLIK